MNDLLPSAIKLLRLPLPQRMGMRTANLYLVAGDALVLIDAGCYSPDGLAMLDKALGDAGCCRGDLDFVILTHGHYDHAGLAARLADGGLPVYVHGDDLWRLGTDYYRQMWHPAMHDFLQGAGVDRAAIEFFGERFRQVSAFFEPVPGARPFSPDVPLAAAGLRLVHTPGHTMGSVCFYHAATRLLFSGDHIAGSYVAAPLHEVGIDPGRPRLDLYLDALDAVAGLDLSGILPGHGRLITDPATVIAATRGHHLRETERLLAMADGCSLNELCAGAHPELSRRDWLLALFKTQVGVEKLTSLAAVVPWTADDGVIRFTKKGSARLP